MDFEQLLFRKYGVNIQGYFLTTYTKKNRVKFTYVSDVDHPREFSKNLKAFIKDNLNKLEVCLTDQYGWPKNKPLSSISNLDIIVVRSKELSEIENGYRITLLKH